MGQELSEIVAWHPFFKEGGGAGKWSDCCGDASLWKSTRVEGL